MSPDKTGELVFLALGGAGEIGMNLNLYGLGPAGKETWVMVDLGITFGGVQVGPHASTSGERGWIVGGDVRRQASIRQVWHLMDIDEVAVALLKSYQDILIFLGGQAAGRVHEAAARAQHMEGSAQKPYLQYALLNRVLGRPEAEHVPTFADDAVAGARCVQQRNR